MIRRRPFPPDFRLYLASESPRRRQLLDGLGVPYTVVPSVGEEVTEAISPRSLAETNALSKACGAVIAPGSIPGSFVLSTDTVVALGSQVLDKPRDRQEARRMLVALEGERHYVVSGVALIRYQEAERVCLVDSTVTWVVFRSLTSPEIESYLDSGEWAGKAGGYAIQGLAALMVDEMRGDYFNVVGLPVALLARLFRVHGFDLLRAVWLD